MPSDLEFDRIQQLIATQARTRLGRSLLTADVGLPPPQERAVRARLTRALERLLEEGGSLTLAGIDEAEPWLEADAPPPGDPSDLLVLLTLARRVAAIRRRLAGGPTELEELARRLPDTAPLVARVAPRLGRDGTVPDNASPELGRLRRQALRLRQELLQGLEGIRRGLSEATSDAPPTLRRDRYCLPVRSGARSEVPGLLLDRSATGATAFIEPFAMVELNNRLVETTLEEREEERRIIAELAAEFLTIKDDLSDALRALAVLDAAQARALFGRLVDGRVVMPGSGGELILRGARHPLLDERLHALRTEVFGAEERRDPSHRAVPLDFRLPEGVRTLVVSGPNAGGKTVVIKTVGLMVLMAAHGVPLPAEEGTVIPDLDFIWSHIGDEQDVAADLSSFSGAMAATGRLLRITTGRGLVLYDELGSGTDPLEGAALGCALLEELTRRSCLTVATTHLAAIAMFASSSPGMGNAAMGFDEAGDRPTYNLAMGRPGRSRALAIAAKSGVPAPVLERSAQLLGEEHLQLHRWLERLEELESELVEERGRLEAAQRGVERLRAETAAAHDRLEDERRRLPQELAQERDRLRRRAQQQLDAALERLDEAIREHERLGRRQRQHLREEALALDIPATEDRNGSGGELEPGARVRLTGLGTEGTLEELRGSRALLTVDGKRLWVAASEVTPLPGRASARPKATVAVSAEEPAEGELMLIGMNSEQAREELEHFLDRALAAGRSRVRVVHGHGTGTLRRMVTDVCRTHPAVRSFRHPPQHLGGSGATEIDLE